MDHATLSGIRTIVTHARCSDGTASAILLHDALPHSEVIFVDYGRGANELPVRDGMLFCDIAPPPAHADAFVSAGAIVLDHHRSARDIVAKFGARGHFAGERTSPGVSGAVLAFREVWLPMCGGSEHRHFAESFANAAGARDTWLRSSPAWSDGCVQHAVLSLFKQEYWLTVPFGMLGRQWSGQYAELGKQRMEHERELVIAAIANGYRFTTTTGTRVFATNVLALASDIAAELDLHVDLVFAFHVEIDRGVPVMRVSLRSHTHVDCAAIAQTFGGGGHTRAAGCTIPMADIPENPFRIVERALCNHSAS